MNIYFILADIKKIIEEEINKIIKNETNIIHYDLIVDSLSKVIEEASYYSLFDEKKYIIVDNFNLKNETEEDMIKNYLNNPNPNSTIILVSSEKLDSRKNITKIIMEKVKFIDLLEIDSKDLFKKVENKFKEKEYKIDYQTINYLITNCLGNYDLIVNEIEKIMLENSNDKIINIETISKTISKFNETDFFKFKDLVIEKKKKQIFNYYDGIVKSNVEILGFISMLEKEYKLIYLCKTLKDDQLNELKIHPYRIKLALEKGFYYSETELLNKMADLCNLDFDIKRGQIDKYLGLELFLLNL